MLRRTRRETSMADAQAGHRAAVRCHAPAYRWRRAPTDRPLRGLVIDSDRARGAVKIGKTARRRCGASWAPSENGSARRPESRRLSIPQRDDAFFGMPRIMLENAQRSGAEREMLAIHFRAKRPGRRQLLQRRRRLSWRDASLVLTVNRAPHTGQLLDHRSSVLPLVRTLRPMSWYTWSPTIRSSGSMALAISRTDPAWSSEAAA